MFNSTSHQEKPTGGAEALAFVAQQVAATIGSAVVCYPVYLDVENTIRPSGDALVYLWRWIALILPALVGFAIGVGAAKLRPRAYHSGRFVWIIPTLWFSWMFARTISEFPFARAVDTYLADGGGLEMTIAPYFYAIGVVVAHRRLRSDNTLPPISGDGNSDTTRPQFPRANPFI